ncbi:MAG: hypothetical protein V1902_01840 [Candidatus Falkowbacteria bacterium]
MFGFFIDIIGSSLDDFPLGALKFVLSGIALFGFVGVAIYCAFNI